MIRVSVIMPIYNVEAYLREAVGSVMAQTLGDWELIAVNDGSSDGSLKLLEELAASDSRIRVITQPNSGKSVARNRGAEAARGDYLYFMDGDDCLEADALEVCCEKLIGERLEVVVFDTDIFDESDTTPSPPQHRRVGSIAEQVYTGTELLEALLEADQYRVPPWLMIVERAFFERHGLRFHPGMPLHEDELFTPQVLLAAQRVGYLFRALLHYRVRPGSIMTSPISMQDVHDYGLALKELGRGTIPRQARRSVRRLRRQQLKHIVYCYRRLRGAGVRAGAFVRYLLPHPLLAPRYWFEGLAAIFLPPKPSHG